MVWAARREQTGERVAVKVVRVVGTLESLDTVTRELSLLQSLRVEGLVGFHEAVVLPGEPVGVALVLDLVDGGSLRSVRAARGHLSPGEATTVVSAVARTLGQLHAIGVVHGDVSPGNVLLDRTGRPALADLGVARLAGEEPGPASGTEGFTAPEVMAGEQPSPASDVYAVGALTWWCVTGAVPAPVALRQLLQVLAPHLPQEWRKVVEECLAPFPCDRPTAAEAALRLFDAVPCEPIRLALGADDTALLTRRIRAGVQLPPPGAETGRRSGRAFSLLGGRARRGLVAGALACLAGLLVLVVLVAGGGAVAGGLGSIALPGGGGGGGAARGRGAQSVHPSVATAGTPVPSQASASEGPGVRRASQPTSQPTGADDASSRPLPPGPGDPFHTDPRALAAAPDTDARGLVQVLADARAAALNAADAHLLRGVDIPGSPAHQDDVRLVEQLRGERRYSGVRLTVRSARLVAREDGSATVRAEVDTGEYRLVDHRGTTTVRPATRGAPVDLVLRWAAEGWRLQRVTAAEDEEQVDATRR